MGSKSETLQKPSGIIIFFTLLWVFSSIVQAAPESGWSEEELAILRLQQIYALPELPPDPTNKYAENPAAVKLGHKIFFDNRFSKNGQIACASCHHPGKSFTDGLAKAIGIGETTRSAPSIAGIAYSPWFFWDGRSDSLWSQALGPLESGVEHGGNRSQYARIIYNDPAYRVMYEGIFGSLPDLSDKNRFPEDAAPTGNDKSDTSWLAMTKADRKAITRIYVNIGKAIAAYERLLIPGPTRFDQYVAAVLENNTATVEGILSADEIAGLKVFIGKGMCVTCHQGPLFTNNGFHNTGVPDPAAIRLKTSQDNNASKSKPVIDKGRNTGVQLALKSEFNCLGEYSDAENQDCSELKFATLKRIETLSAFKVPTLRNIAETAPYMHAGQFKDLAEVLKHYNTVPRAYLGRTDLMAINLNQKEIDQLESFLHSLSSPMAVAPEWLRAPAN